MAKNKQYIKLDLRKQKNTNHRTFIVKKDKYEKCFASDGPISEEELKEGVVIDVNVQGDKAIFTMVKIYGPKCTELLDIAVDEYTAKTSGVCKWGKAGFASYNPYAEDAVTVLGESVKYASDGALTLNYNNMAHRAQLLCYAVSNMSGYENIEKFAKNVKLIINKFAFSVIEMRGLTSKDKEDILEKSQELFSCDVVYFAQNFEDLQIFIKKRVETHSKNNWSYAQKSHYIDVYK